MEIKCFCRLILFTLLVPSAIAQPAKQTANGNSAFAFELFSELFRPDMNVFFSPYSISSALAMTYAGARNETERQMSKVLHYDMQQLNTHQGFFEINAALAGYNRDSLMQLSLANALWKDEGWWFKQDFLDLTKKYYGSSIFPLAGAKPINDWAALHTKGKIKEIVKEGDLSLARLVLTNAIYFKGDWLTGFDEKHTQKSKFTALNGEEMHVDMMFQKNAVNYFEDERNQILELPYKGEGISMVFILPKDGNSIASLAKNLDQELFSHYNAGLKKQRVNIYFPRFSFKTKYELKDVLKKMGMPDAFHPVKADFSGMSGGLSISKVIHKAFIEVNEKGSEAAAVTAVIMIEKAAEKEIVFKASRPFVVLIRDKVTRSVLFMGSVVNPIYDLEE